MKTKEELDLVGQFAGFVGMNLKDIDQKWSNKPGQNKANKLDPRQILKQHIDQATNLITDQTVHQIEATIPPPIPLTTFNPPIDVSKDKFQKLVDNQLEFELAETTQTPKIPTSINERFDKLEYELNLIKAMLKEIKKNTSKRTYKRKPNESRPNTGPKPPYL